MKNRAFHKGRNPLRTRQIVAVLLVTGLAGSVLYATARPWQEKPATNSPAELLDGFRHVEAASVSDAIEQITGKKMYMSHRMRPIFPTKFAGFALTVALKKEANDDPNALQGMLTAIDSGDADSVYVMSVEDGADIAGMGGLMAACGTSPTSTRSDFRCMRWELYRPPRCTIIDLQAPTFRSHAVGWT